MEVIVTKDLAGSRIDGALARLHPSLSRSKVRHLLDAGHVRLNALSCKPSQSVRAGDCISWDNPEPVATETLPEDISLSILHEDDSLVVLNKPSGLVVHPGAGNWSGTLVNALLHHFEHLSSAGGAQRPGIVHRLDKDTTGALVVAKNDGTHQDLTRQFAGRTVLKIYLALATGVPKAAHGEIHTRIGRDPRHRQRMAVLGPERGRDSRTDYRVRQMLGANSLVECRLHTGRTHQIRVHLKHLGIPLCGDQLYAGRRAGTWPRPMLHSWRLGFIHPQSKKWMEFTAPVPDDFLQAGTPPDLLPHASPGTSRTSA